MPHICAITARDIASTCVTKCQAWRQTYRQTRADCGTALYTDHAVLTCTIRGTEDLPAAEADAVAFCPEDQLACGLTTVHAILGAPVLELTKICGLTTDRGSFEALGLDLSTIRGLVKACGLAWSLRRCPCKAWGLDKSSD